jgi:endonuclease YncB( thermonuclease family)|tara:strand:+ start:1246 stop:1632 length:387 start_codon:yes stop_codon:yes gene_type:complete
MSNPLYYYEGTVVRVVDGDTIDVDVDLGFGIVLKKKRLRFLGIDTPEKRTRNLAEKKLGLQATARVEELCGEKVRFVSEELDKYGRVLAAPYTVDDKGITGVNICETLIEEGLAVPYFGGTKTKVWGE